MAVLETSTAPEASPGLEEFLDRIRPAAVGLLRRYRIPDEDSEDILQEALLIFILRSPAVEEPGKWLLGTLRNRCLMYWRDRRRQSFLTVNSPLLDATADPRLSLQERISLLRDLKRLLARLPEHYRLVLETRYLEGLSPAETASRLGYRESGIYKIIERGKTALAREMEREGYRRRPA